MFLSLGESRALMMSGPSGAEKKQERAKNPRRTAIFILACTIAGGAAYWALEAGLPLTPLKRGHELAVFCGFFLVPLGILWATGRKLQLGSFDRGLLEGIGLYMLFLVPLLFLIPLNKEFFSGYRMAPATAALWAFYTFIQVSSVDFFTKRIVQLEVWQAWGKSWGLAAQFAAWSGAHVVEYMWLKDLTGPAGAILFLGTTGALTGLLYLRTKNVLGMMVGHWLLNLILAGAAVIYLG
jgi:hypothetical protein